VKRWISYTLYFKFDAGTSRGILKKKLSYFLVDQQNDKIGECSLISGLSPDDQELLASLGEDYSNHDRHFIERHNPAYRFAWEMMERSLTDPTDLFASGQKQIPINGLIWMSDAAHMKQQIKEKLKQDYRCIKLKIGAIDLESELDLIKNIRQEYKAAEIEIRVDANGAFATESALEILKRLRELDIHSIEQPIAPNQWDEMARLCEKSPLPIALDEELIEKTRINKSIFLSRLSPAYIILKPSLLGGFQECEAWIQAASDLGIGWWATSALESNVGLSMIASWLSEMELPSGMYQGLGTGMLYNNNIPSPLKIQKGYLTSDPNSSWNFEILSSRI